MSFKFASSSFSRKLTTPLTLTATALLALATLVACDRSSTRAYSLFGDTEGIITTRPEAGPEEFYLIKLKSPALLSQVTGGKVDPKALKALSDEQDEVLKKLKELSTDIRVIYRYRMVLNGFAVLAPTALEEKIGAIAEVSHLEGNGNFTRPSLPAASTTATALTSLARTSVKFIGADDAHAKGIRGQGMKVGVIDTGIDYTHAMLGGVGTVDAFKAVNPDTANSAFPNTKVVGGIDLVGTEFNSASPIFGKRLPKMDPNPIDEGGHGSHVAGTIAGRGDGINSYDGVAPDATLYALKVFGADGSTSDNVVIAALEYAADPNGDGNIDDKLDVVNLSLGSGFGSDHILYSEAIQNSSRSGTVVVCAAGNNGDEPYIVGSPGATTEALSVAASVDDMEQNWKFRASRFSTPTETGLLVEAVEGAITKPLEKTGPVTASLVYVGTAATDFTPEVKLSLQGKIALIDRGAVAFSDKIARAADAGAIGVVMVNNQDGAPFQMGGAEGVSFLIPGIMVSKAFGEKLKEGLKTGDVTGELKTSDWIERPENIDTMADFSSRGPRSIDGLIKPEISAPGSKIISAKMGGGAEAVQMNGTSMASPHMAGVMALLKQTHPTLTTSELKSLAMSTARSMVDQKKDLYSVARQGAGRVQVMKALEAKVVTEPAALSLGEMTLETAKTVSRNLRIKNISSAPLSLTLKLIESTPGLQLTSSSLTAGKLSLEPQASEDLSIRFTIRQEGLQSGRLILVDDAGVEIARLPVLAVANPVSQITAQSLVVHSTSELDSQGAAVDLSLINKSQRDGEAYLFNFLGRDSRKPNPTLDPFRTTVCDLAESGYRVIQKDGEAGPEQVLQIGVKLFEPLTTWDLCELSVLIDSNNDQTADQELVGIKESSLDGLTSKKFSSVLLDANKARKIRKDFDTEIVKPRKPSDEEPKLDFTAAIEAMAPMMAFEHSTIAIIEVPIASLKLRPDGALAVRISTNAQSGSAIEPDDFLSQDPKRWMRINVGAGGSSYFGMSEKISLKSGQSTVVALEKGAGKEALWIVQPKGRPVVGGLGSNQQAEVIKPRYQN